MAKRALITGITGQDGYYLAKLLLDKGYEVHGLVRPDHYDVSDRLGDITDRVTIEHAELTDSLTIRVIVERLQPDEIYNLAAPSHVGRSFSVPESTIEIVGVGCLRLLEAVRQASPRSRLYQAASSEMFGRAAVSPQNEQTPFHPRNPYGVAKLAAYWAVVNYRETYGLFACNGITYNHESERRGEEFVTRKISIAAARIALGLQKRLTLGNLDARRDWGFAPEYVEAMWLMLQQPEPDDFVLGTGVTHSVRDFCEAAFNRVNLNYKDFVDIDPALVRPSEEHLLVADPSKAARVLGWRARTPLRDIVAHMVDADLSRQRRALR